ncbi:hypothetical protein PoB_006287200 [Plakobranchus ocellatus]|uniref:Uncharacterized protein n=1 Tax=Plakobranchus ocellatus TaxID=259542 RepID=A0AAV4CWS4_9GAST|nr:hypothetical protein PoB_006287200 [Plakobranchus ocellatus]
MPRRSFVPRPLATPVLSPTVLKIPAGSVGGTVASESALRSARIVLSRVRIPLLAPYIVVGLLKTKTNQTKPENPCRGKERPTVPHRYRPSYNRKRWNCDIIRKPPTP